MSDLELIAPWRKSRHSNSGECVEASAWRKSSHSVGSGECVEASVLSGGNDGGRVVIRHSKNPDGPVIWYTRLEWEAFLAGVRDGEFDWDVLVPPVPAT